MLRKKEVFTVITPIPSFIPRQLAIDILHSHSEVITLNPLVLDHKPIKAPRDAAADEYYSTWYEITERIQYLPGLGKMGSGKISFNGCFHNLPWGLQTHIYAPMNVDLRNKYRIAGNQPGYEPTIPLEMGLRELGAPADGLYLHEDIEIRCNIAAMGFVKSELKKAGKQMVSRIIKKAELLDAGALQAMIEDGQLKTYNPADRSEAAAAGATLMSPPTPQSLPAQPSPTGGSFAQPPMSPRMPYQVPRVGSMHGPPRPGSAASGSLHSVHGSFTGSTAVTPPPMGVGGYAQNHPGQQLPSELPLNATGATASFPMELPGDFYHPQHSATSQPSPGYLQGQGNRASTPGRQSVHSSQPSPADPQRASSQSGQFPYPAGEQGQRPLSFQSDGTSPAGTLSHRSSGGIGAEHKSFSQELPTHRETNEEYRQVQQPQPSPGLQGPQPSPGLQGQQKYAYNPADYAKVPTQRLAYQGTMPQGQQFGHAR
jgi:hypothetical protein